MAFSKSFPKTVEGSSYPLWKEVYLTAEEEKEEERKCREENIKIMKECIDDAAKIVQEKALKGYQTDVVNMATALFEKRASHAVHWKESRAKDKFDKGV
jgi:DNA helicase TIP49 (TBP-interacting protein)